jgi:monoamine oxidase
LKFQDQLESYFGNQARNPIQFFVKDWRDEPYIGGGPANIAGPGRLQNFFLLRKIHKKVHFAGTAMASQWCGYMTGQIFVESFFLFNPYS